MLQPRPSRSATMLRSALACSADLRARARRGRRVDEGGYLVIEAVVFMLVILVAVGGYLGVARATNVVQRQSAAIDTVAQRAQGILAQAEATPWRYLALESTDGSPTSFDPDGSGPITAQPTVTTSVDLDASVAGRLKHNLGTATVKGIAFSDQRVYITWQSGSSLSTAKATGDFGTKRITVVLTYRESGSSVSKTATYFTTRTPTVAEAAPVSVGVAP
ncbi:hypothetical protein [Nocardioides sp. Leaf285]|uniref:hypothetical protein n=1 Tax=Nocardioides sp. Leaf285 TaxID=1736322 RepID=UPI0007027BB2|nr:hypothetical protein [Nocardioides sp. Leaf285]KQP63155.1 hypothetical protein ASF47_19285 [Nocardioides sp. Leaf285]